MKTFRCARHQEMRCEDASTGFTFQGLFLCFGSIFGTRMTFAACSFAHNRKSFSCDFCEWRGKMLMTLHTQFRDIPLGILMGYSLLQRWRLRHYCWRHWMHLMVVLDHFSLFFTTLLKEPSITDIIIALAHE